MKDQYGRYLFSYYSVEGCNAEEIIKKANDSLKRLMSKSQHIGSIGDKIEKTLTLKKIASFETHYSYYGETNYVYNFVDEDGNHIVWKTAKSPSDFDSMLEEGSVVTLKGTIKEHSEWNGEPQTIVTRCRIK